MDACRHSSGDGGHIAHVYLEGSDGHRGWFQSSLLTYVAHQSVAQHDNTYSSYNHARAVAAINHFINHDLSAFYFETAKDRLYGGIPMEGAASQHLPLVILGQLADHVRFRDASCAGSQAPNSIRAHFIIYDN